MRILVLCSLVSTFHLCCPLTGAMAVDALPKQYLVFGGNGMMGSATMLKLLTGEEDDEVKVVVVNRGNWYWDTAFTVKPLVRHIKCDRMNKLSNCPELTNFVAGVPYIDAVVDFSAYQPSVISDALELVQGKAKLYVYISTDSVYEVCVKNHTEPTREEDAIRPTSEEDREEARGRDNYGHHKLECEETLRHYRQDKNGPPFISLRLPDVVGPRDNTYRWWIYQLWINLEGYLEKPVSIPASLTETKLSLVYVDDVADLIVTLLKNEIPDEAIDEAFNLAIDETPTLLEMLNDMKNQLNVTELIVKQDENEESIKLFPSVHLGPIDISKAKRVLNWEPTEWSKVLKETVQFYESAIKEIYLSDQKATIVQTMQAHFTSKPYDVIRGLKNVYGLSFAERKDEL